MRMTNVVKIETPEWLAEIAIDAGANLYSLKHRLNGFKLLRSPASLENLHAQPEMYGIPVLLPPNRIDGGRFEWRGRQYELPLNEPERGNHLHGIVLGRKWRLVESGRDVVKMVYDFSAMPGFPHDFTLTMTYHFTPEAVIQYFAVHNHSGLAMPFGLGFHTAFNFPSDAWATITTGDSYWEIVRPRCLPSGRLLPWRTEDRIFRDDRAVSCHCPMTTEYFEGQPFRGMVINYPDEHARLYYEVSDQYRHWCLWNGGGRQGFFCFEPMTWMVNAPNLDLPPDVTGMQALEPDQAWKAQTRIHLAYT